MNKTACLLGTLLGTAWLGPVSAASLDVLVLDSASLAPVAGAQVFVGTNGRGEVLLTDTSGKVTVTTSGTGPQTVTAATSTQKKVLGRPVFTTVGTTVQGVTGANVTVYLGPYQLGITNPAGAEPSEIQSGSVAGFDVDVPGGWTVASPLGYTSGALDGVSDWAYYSVTTPAGESPFLYAAQIAAGEDGAWTTGESPLLFSLVLDTTDGTNIVLDRTFDTQQKITASGLEANGSEEFPTALCSNLSLVVPGNRGAVPFNPWCEPLPVGATSGVVSVDVPSLTGTLTGGAYGQLVSVADSRGGQIRSGIYTAPAISVTLPPLPAADPYEPILMTAVPGTTYNFTPDTGATRELMALSETRLGPGGFVHSNTTWVALNLTPTQPLTFPKVPRTADLPALGFRLPELGNQTAVVIVEYGTPDATGYASYAYAYLDTYLPAPEEPVPPTRWPEPLRALQP